MMKVDRKWAVIADFHVRRNDFMDEPGFYFVRIGAAYYTRNNFFLAGGVGHMWLSSSVQQQYIFTGENRIYQQLQHTLKAGGFSIMQRFRNEQRWQQKIAGGEKTGYTRFSDRIRYLASVSVPVFKNKRLPELVVAGEIHFHFGKEIVYNRFDQNRLFIGIKQKVTKQLSFDFGYMNLFQKKYTQNESDDNHILRFFVYYHPMLQKTEHK